MKILHNLAHVLGGLVGTPAVRLLLNQRWGRFGTMTQLRIDRENKVIEGEVLLQGETAPIRFRLGQYDFQSGAAGGIFRAGQVEISRAWMNQLALELLQNKPVPVPAGIAKWLNMVL